MKCRNKPKDSGLSVPSTGTGEAAKLPEERTEGQHQSSLLRISLFFGFALMKNMTRYLEGLIYIRQISHTGEDTGREIETVPER